MAEKQSKPTGLVQQLFFPSYAASGSNEAFQAKPESVISDASTVIRNNCSSTGNMEPQSPPKLPRLAQHDSKILSKTDECRESSPLPLAPTQLLQTVANIGRVDISPTEEEASPRQTAFGKELLFQRTLRSKKSGSDISSTASEMGTVIGESRLQELDDMGSPATPTKGSDKNPWGDDESLSLPLLDGKFSPGAKEEQQPSPRTAKGLFSTIRRIGSLGSTFSTSAHFSMSAPNTPSNHYRRKPDRDEQAPSSFLLRSPGSLARMSAKKSSEKILYPRFSHRPFGQIPEHQHAKPSAFHLARACFSYDAYDTAADEEYEISSTDLPHLFVARANTQTQTQTQTLYRGSFSWDNVGRTSKTSRSSSAFRPSSSFVRNAGMDSSRSSSVFAVPGTPSKADLGSVESFSPKGKAVELISPQRLEIEREDALDILSCLVERGISLKECESDEGEKKMDEVSVVETMPGERSELQSDLRMALQQLQHLSSVDPSDTDGSAHKTRACALQELRRSHDYALEMRRVSKSASSWLRSIGRWSAAVGAEPSSPKLKVIEDHGVTPSARENAVASIEVLALRAMLHSAKMEAKEKAELAERLNSELAKCRAEIGRLKSPNNSGFRSPNRSILDESDDISVVHEEEEIDRSFDNASPIPEREDSQCLDTSFDDIIPLRQDQSDLVKFQAALEEANAMICKLHADLKKQSPSANIGVLDEAPIVEVSVAQEIAHQEPRNPSQPSPPAHSPARTLYGSTHDVADSVTEWQDLRPPLPPPPDHGLRSPIVTTLLEEWTSDNSLHDSLFAWMEDVLSGCDPATIPPLTLSSLDNQVRDGFIMHLLPLLLRRPDIRVDVQTRAHRLTRHDVAVSVEGVMPPQAPLGVRRHLEALSVRSDVGADSTTHSATTALISNHSVRRFFSEDTQPRSVSSRLSYDEIADGVDVQGQSGLMSALGGAFSGLLHRRRPESGHESNFVDTPLSRVSEDDREVQPYHRVVAAPPGRLCITFVEYRGHAMVSDVAPASPLVGWIFPSDILIAIDELPVSGMRVRDIIQVLKQRTGRQRALRVISSHDMTELTLNNSSSLNDGH